MKKTVTIDRSELLDLVYDALIFNYDNPPLFDRLARWLGKLPDVEILSFAHESLGEEDQDPDDLLQIVNVMTEWRNEWIPSANNHWQTKVELVGHSNGTVMLMKGDQVVFSQHCEALIGKTEEEILSFLKELLSLSGLHHD